jgi:Flp pilus assembly protein TadG
MIRRHLHRPRSRGQALVEFALIIPLFLLMLFGIIDIGRVIWANDALTNAAREGARFASVKGSNTDMVTTATKQNIRDATQGMAIAGGMNTVVTVCYSVVHVSTGTAGCTGDTDELVNGVAVTNARGALVTVTVSSTVPILTGSLLGMGNFSVSGSSTVLVNN